jgi:hypothetical protein
MQVEFDEWTYSRHSTGPWDTSDQACVQAFKSWSSTSALWRAALPPDSASALSITSSTVFVTRSFYISQGLGDGSTTTACDGIPRFKFHSPPTRATIATVTITSRAVRTYVYTPTSDSTSFSTSRWSCPKEITETILQSIPSLRDICEYVAQDKKDFFWAGKCPTFETMDPDFLTYTEFSTVCATSEPCSTTTKTNNKNQNIYTLCVGRFRTATNIHGSFSDSTARLQGGTRSLRWVLV